MVNVSSKQPRGTVCPGVVPSHPGLRAARDSVARLRQDGNIGYKFRCLRLGAGPNYSPNAALPRAEQRQGRFLKGGAGRGWTRIGSSLPSDQSGLGDAPFVARFLVKGGRSILPPAIRTMGDRLAPVTAAGGRSSVNWQEPSAPQNDRVVFASGYREPTGRALEHRPPARRGSRGRTGRGHPVWRPVE